MKTVTDDFIHAQKKASPYVVREVYYKRRYWDQANEEFTWESSWVQLDEDQIKFVSPISWNLDNEFLNEFRVSNVTIIVDNTDNRWSEGNLSGFFKQDSQSPNHMYEPYWTKFQIRIGYELEDGTDEVVSVFTGVATDYIMNTTNGTAQIRVEGLESLLKNTKAEEIATEVDQENLGAGNGVKVDFTTANNGVGGITLVSIDGITKKQGADYTISDLSDTSNPGKVTFNVAPAIGETVRATYYYWTQNVDFETIVGDLLTEGGISSGNQDVEDVIIFENDVLNSFVYDTQIDFDDNGTLANVLSSEYIGYLSLDLRASALRDSQTWMGASTGWTFVGPDISFNGTETIFNYGGDPNDNNQMYRFYNHRIGSYAWKYKFTDTNADNAISFQYQSSFKPPGVVGFDNWFGITIWPSEVKLHKGEVYSSTVTFSSGAAAYHTVEMVIFTDKTEFYIDSTLFFTVTRGLPEDYNIAFKFTATAGGERFRLKEIETPKSPMTGTWISDTVDAGSAPKAFDKFDHNEFDSDAIDINYFTATSSDDIAYEAYAEVPATNIPQSTKQRYIKVKAEINLYPNVEADEYRAWIDNFILRFTTSSTPVLLPELTGYDVYQAIQSLGKFCNYEYGFKPDETFFFRQKKAGSSVMKLTHKDYMMNIASLVNGLDRTYGSVRSEYGNFVAEINDDALNPASPTARTKQRRFSINPDSNIQIASTADITTGIAKTFFNFLSVNRRRAKIDTILLPQIDLADIITISFYNSFPAQQWYFGDNSIYLGKENIHFWGEGQQILTDFVGKVIGVRYDTDRHTCSFELEEAI